MIKTLMLHVRHFHVGSSLVIIRFQNCARCFRQIAIRRLAIRTNMLRLVARHAMTIHGGHVLLLVSG